MKADPVIKATIAGARLAKVETPPPPANGVDRESWSDGPPPRFDDNAPPTEVDLPVDDLARRVAHLPAGWHLQRPPGRPFVLYPYIPFRAVSALVGTGASSKTLALCEVAVSIVTGADWRGHPTTHDCDRADVLVLTWEDEVGDYHAKLFSLIQARADIMPFADQIAQRIHFVCLHGSDLRLVAASEHGKPGPTLMPHNVVALIKRDFPHVVQVFVETVSRANGAGEDNEGMSAVESAAGVIAHGADVSVTLVHHTSKAAALAGLLDAHAGRGGSSLADNCRSTIVVAVVTADSPISLYPPGFMATDFEDREIIVIEHARCSYARRAPRMHLERVYPADGAPFLRALLPQTRADSPKADKDAEALSAWMVINVSAEGVTEKAIRTRSKEFGLTERPACAALARLVRDGSVSKTLEKQYGDRGRDVERYRLKGGI